MRAAGQLLFNDRDVLATEPRVGLHAHWLIRLLLLLLWPSASRAGVGAVAAVPAAVVAALVAVTSADLPVHFAAAEFSAPAQP